MLVRAVALALCLSGAPALGCGIAIDVPLGTLKLNDDATQLSSAIPGGAAAVVLVSNGLFDGAFNLTVSAPTLTEYPAGFNSSGAVLEVAYTSAGLLSFISQAFTTTQTTVHVNPLVLSSVALVLHNRITAAGFASGTYKTKTVVTCS